MSQNTKKCHTCGRELPVSEFNSNYKAKDGLQYRCKKCQSETAKQSRNKLKERIAELEAKLKQANTTTRNSLSQFAGNELITELKMRGYHGTLTYKQQIEL